MSLFERVSDEGVRKFLEDPSPPKDYNLFASQIRHAREHQDKYYFEHGDWHSDISFWALSDAQYYFGNLDLFMTHECLRRYWEEAPHD